MCHLLSNTSFSYTLSVVMLFHQDSNGGSLSNENDVGDKNSCYCTHSSSSQGSRKRQEPPDASYFNSRLKRKPDFEGDRYLLSVNS